jgi:putative transposase
VQRKASGVRFHCGAPGDVACVCTMQSLGVTRQGFYEYERCPKTCREAANENLDAQVRDVFHEHQGRYGSPRVSSELQRRKVDVGKRRVEESMVRQGLFSWRTKKFVTTTKSALSHTPGPNRLERNFSAGRPNERWVTAITFLPTSEGWLYLAVIIDLFSRRVVDWSTSSIIDTTLPFRALHSALLQRKTTLPLLHHTDRGSQYTSALYRKEL